MAGKVGAGLWAGVAAVAMAVTIGMAGPAAALSSAAAGVPTMGRAAGQLSGGERPPWCDRVDKALDRRQLVVSRIEGDAGTRGSLAWLNGKAAAASAAGNTEVATLFTDLAALRNQVLDPLKTVITDLTAVQQARCG